MRVGERRSVVAVALLAALALAPWLALYLRQVVNFNEIWLVTCSGRLLAGQGQTTACFDQEPPLCILTELLPALLARLTHVSPLIWLPLYNFTLIGLSVAGTACLIRRQPGIAPRLGWLLIFAYLIANTILASGYIGERDHIALLGFFPFVLLQFAVTDGLPQPGRTARFAILALGAVSVLIKPHYGVVPVCVLAVRAWRRREVRALVRDADFIALAVATLAYAVVIALFFRDYVEQIFPDAMRFYGARPDNPVWPPALAVFIPCVILLLAPVRQSAITVLAQRWAWLALACLVPYIAQNKGYGYHLVPAEICLFMAGAATATAYIEGRFAGWEVALVVLIAGAAYALTPPNFKTPTTAAYRDYPLTALASRGGTDCHFFMLDSMREVQDVAAYARCGLATRFPSLWFLQYLLSERYALDHGLPHTATAAELNEKDRKYAALVAGDFARWRPETVMIADAYYYDGQTVPFDFGGFFSANNADFARLWRQYQVLERVTVDRPDAMRGTRFASRVERKTYTVYVLGNQ